MMSDDWKGENLISLKPAEPAEIPAAKVRSASADIEKVKDCIRKHMTIQEAADHLGVSYYAIWNAAKRAGLSFKGIRRVRNTRWSS